MNTTDAGSNQKIRGDKMGIGRTLSDILKEKNITVTDLARNVGIAPTTIYSIIDRDNMKIDISVLIKICNSLDVDINVFYKDHYKYRKQKSNFLTTEEAALLDMFRSIDNYGKKTVSLVCQSEYDRCQSSKKDT